ncbi:MAG: DUF2934 domain-containing protein [Gammaproteobacteria bacterium]|nr:DUF2934 domain-containing protein [Gammaproteobacteria bacterium]
MTETHSSTRDTGALGGLAEQLRSKGNPETELYRLRVAKLAYFKAQVRGCPAGPELIDWLQAEAETDAGNPERSGFGDADRA